MFYTSNSETPQIREVKLNTIYRQTFFYLNPFPVFRMHRLHALQAQGY